MIILIGRKDLNRLIFSKPSATTIKLAERELQPLLDAGVCILPSMRIGSFEKVLSCEFALSQIQNACGLLLTTCRLSD